MTTTYHEERLKAKLVHEKLSIDDFADIIGVNRFTAYRKIREGTFTRSELERLLATGNFSDEDIVSIFFDPVDASDAQA